MILHVLPRLAWEVLGPDDEYVPPAFAADGFVHCSPNDEVLLAVANAYYGDADDELVVWDIDEAALPSPVRWERADPAPPPPGAPADTRFPHVYGPIPSRAVVRVRRLVRGPAGGPAYVAYAATC